MNIETLVNLDLSDKENVNKVYEAIDKNPALVKEMSKEGRTTPLHAAAWYGNSKLVSKITFHLLLLEESLDAQDVVGNTALHHATMNGQKHIVDFLMSQEADTHVLNKAGIPACHESLRRPYAPSSSKEEAPTVKVLSEPGSPQFLTDFLKEDHVESKETCEASHSAVERKRVVESSSQKTLSVDSETEEFEDFEEIEVLTESEASKASLQARLVLAKERFAERNSLSGQTQQLFSGAGIGMLNALNAFSAQVAPTVTQTFNLGAAIRDSYYA